MNDRELLELAAKAIGMAVLRDGERPPSDRKYWFFNQVGDNPPALYDATSPVLTRWAPLTDDGDALRLAVKLGMRFDCDHVEHATIALRIPTRSAVEDHNNDAYAATRRAIVRAAAEIGRGMP